MSLSSSYVINVTYLGLWSAATKKSGRVTIVLKRNKKQDHSNLSNHVIESIVGKLRNGLIRKK